MEIRRKVIARTEDLTLTGWLLGARLLVFVCQCAMYGSACIALCHCALRTAVSVPHDLLLRIERDVFVGASGIPAGLLLVCWVTLAPVSTVPRRKSQRPC